MRPSLHPEDGGSMVLRNFGFLPQHSQRHNAEVCFKFANQTLFPSHCRKIAVAFLYLLGGGVQPMLECTLQIQPL
jgi:hypothetical protein